MILIDTYYCKYDYYRVRIVYIIHIYVYIIMLTHTIGDNSSIISAKR